MTSRQQNTFGFTLVELAVSLMVIGLLIGGVLKGQELIQNARVTSVIKQLKAYDAATLMFQNTYGALPGDITKPEALIPNCTAEICILPGDGSDKVGDIKPGDSLPNFIEVLNYFPHMTKAGVIKSSVTGVSTLTASDTELQELAYERTVFGDIIQGRFDYGITTNTPSHIYYISNWPTNTGGIPTKQIVTLDLKLDDGLPRKGVVQLIGAAPACPTETVSGVVEYKTKAVRGNCAITVTAGF